MIYAIGSGDKLKSNAKDAGIRMHEFRKHICYDSISQSEHLQDHLTHVLRAISL